MVGIVPFSSTAHTLFQINLGYKTKLYSCFVGDIHATVGQKLDATTRQGCLLTFETGRDGEYIGSEIGKPEWNTCARQLFIQCVRNRGRQFADSHRMIASDVVTIADC